MKDTKLTTVAIPAPNFQTAIFDIKGTAPLVIHRFSAKTKEQMKQKMETGKAASSKKIVKPNPQTTCSTSHATYCPKKLMAFTRERSETRS